MGKHKNSSSDKSSPKKAKKKKHAESVLSPFRVQQLELVVSLLPNCLSDIQHHISKNVNGLLMKFNEGADGVILSYTNIKFSNGEAVGRILDEQPYLHFKVTIDALVFRASVGQKLRGKINKCSGSHVGFLVYNLFNGMISAKQLKSSGYAFAGGEWKKDPSTPKAPPLVVGEQLDFQVELFQECAGLISIEGKLPN